MSVLARIRTYGSLVAIAHTVFAMPFAASAVVLSLAVPHEKPTVLRVVAMIVCMVCARTSAMAFNRWADRDVDAKNPRTRVRHLPAGTVRPAEALGLTIVSGLAFVAVAATLGFWPGALALPVLVVLLGYSYAKRFTWGAHAWLGVALALAPGGAWIAMGARPGAGIVLLMTAVVTWLLGFDVLYSLQDEEFDRREGLRSIPARFGRERALRISAGAHVVTVLALAGCGLALGRGIAFACGVVVAAGLLVYEHSLVRRRGLAAIDKAFFDVNAWVSVLFFGLVCVDAFLRAR
ncbi:MAG TPA: 4-hydroxybenzoate octaprenyltransferase [Polyangiaceae bacterium]|jgi:4-hydroxybenzoate polyprenyltransferase|nr:4-hydroxybenzoate octaprenyltransferase [Polyangiaceae bacterium]